MKQGLQQGKQDGIQEGLKQGEEKLKQTALKLKKIGLSDVQRAQATSLSIPDIAAL